MSRLWTPPKVSKELRLSRMQIDADIVASLEPGDPPEPLNSRLKELDPRLYLARARGTVRAGTPLKPGYWHVIRDNSDRDAGLSVTPIENAIGGYLDAIGHTERIVEMMKRNDLQRPGALRERELYRMKREMEEKRAQEDWLKDKVQEGVERWNAGNRAFIGWTPEGQWTQTARARREK